MGQTFRWSYLASLLIHFVFFAWAFYIASPEPSPKNSTLEMEWIEDTSQPQATPESAGAKPAKKSSVTKGNKLKPGRKAFFKNFSPQSLGSHSAEKDQVRHQEGWAGNEVMETMNGMGLSEYSENYYFFEILSHKLNKNIPFPKEIYEHRYEGKFWVQVQIDQQGRLLRIISRSHKCPILEAYVLINIYRALKHSLPRKYWYTKDKDLALVLNFDYRVSSIPNIQTKQTVKYFKNKFNFKRVAKVPDILRQAMHDYARYIPPVVPTPLGPSLDFIRLYKMIEAWQEEDRTVQKRNRRIHIRDKFEKMLQQAKKKHL